jgi:hypothetical protein
VFLFAERMGVPRTMEDPAVRQFFASVKLETK